MARIAKPLAWIGRSRDDMKRLPREVQSSFGFDLNRVQCGEHPRGARPLKGYGGAGVVDLVEDYDGNTYRAVHTVRFADIVYFLHVFQKKSRSGIATPKPEIDMIKARLRRAEEEYDAWRRARSLPR